MSYQIKLEQFEGPLDFLLDLIESRKLSISTVSLAKITDDYIKYIKTLKDLPLDEVSNFIVVAATLMLIKSRSLLPEFELQEEEQKDIQDLERRLKLLARLRELSRNIKEAWLASPAFSREAFQGFEFGFIEPKGTGASELVLALKFLVASFPKIAQLPEKTLEKVISIEEKMLELVGRLSERLKASFQELTGSKNKLEVIIGFLALLELVKQGALLVKQEERFGEIRVQKK